MSASPLFDEHGKLKGIVHVAKDISESKRIEKDLMETKNKMVLHEIRTSLTVVKEVIEIIADGTAGPLTPEQKEFLDIAKRNVERLGRLINDVLDFSKMEAKKSNCIL